MAFGGAGMMVSAPLADKMYGIWDSCFEQYRFIFGGDEMVTRCAAQASGKTKDTVMTEELGLHQFDIPGDTTGVLQGGIPMLNLHHYIGGFWVHLFGYGTYKSEFDQIRVVKQAAEFLGGDNMFRRLVFGDGQWLVTLGYSVTLFDTPIRKINTQRMEHTWYEGYNLHSYKDRDPVQERRDGGGKPVKQTFYLDDVRVKNRHEATFVYAMADKWDEHLTSEERPRLSIHWDGCWNKREAKECGGEGEQEDEGAKRATAEEDPKVVAQKKKVEAQVHKAEVLAEAEAQREKLRLAEEMAAAVADEAEFDGGEIEAEDGAQRDRERNGLRGKP